MSPSVIAYSRSRPKAAVRLIDCRGVGRVSIANEEGDIDRQSYGCLVLVSPLRLTTGVAQPSLTPSGVLYACNRHERESTVKRLVLVNGGNSTIGGFKLTHYHEHGNLQIHSKYRKLISMCGVLSC